MLRSIRPCAAAFLIALIGCSDGPDKDASTNNATAATNNQTAAANNAEPQLYRLAASYPLGDEPRKPVIANLNGDSFPDVIVVNQFSSQVQYFLGDGNGGFSTEEDTLSRAVAALAADFDDDGIDDLALSVEGEPRVDVVLDPVGTPFVISLDVSALPDGLAVADFDGDADLDLAVSVAGTLNDPGASVAVFGWGESTFGPERLASVGLQPRGLAVLGERDLVVLLGTKSALVLQNNGTGSFAASAPFGLGDGVLDFAIIDIDGSGTPDVVAADLSTGTVRAALDVPGSDAELLTEVPAPYGISTLRANDDETPDLAVVSIDDANVVGLLSKPDGTYARSVIAELEDATRLGDIAVADLDGDELDDLLVVERNRDAPGILHVFLSTPQPTR